MVENEILRTGIYLRVSTEEQAKEGFSINAQKEKAKETINNAIEYLSVYKDNEAKLLLIELAKYIIERKT